MIVKEPSQVLLSVYCLAYNQVAYIKQCLDGILAQRTAFKFIVVVHDDASTDGTDDIIRAYADAYPDIIVPIFETANQYSLQNGSIRRKMDACIQGEYIAYCEGDDYWTDPDKLQRQVDFLEAHKEYSLSSENAMTLFTKTGEEHLFSDDSSRDYSFEDLLLCRRFPTASVVFRSKFEKDIAELKPPTFDTLIWCCLAQKGKIHFNSVVSSVYRRGDGLTSADPVRWAFQNEAFNQSVKSNFDVPKHILRKRTENVLQCNFTAFFVAKKQGDYKCALKLLAHSLRMSPTFFIKHVIANKIGNANRRINAWYSHNKYDIWRFRYNVLPLFRKGIKKHRDIDVVVSLTSFPPRFPLLHLGLKSILNQTVRPSKVILYLDSNVAKKDIPLRVRILRIYGLSIKSTGAFLKPHKKYLYAMKEYPESVIITVDDDVIYPKRLVGDLLNSFSSYPNCVSSARTHLIAYDENGHAAPYCEWQKQCEEVIQPSDDLLATGVGGVLYPPSIFDMSKDFFKEDIIIQNCLMADDIWLKFCELYFGVQVKFVNTASAGLSIAYKESVPRLCDANVERKENDMFIARCERYFGINLVKRG